MKNFKIKQKHFIALGAIVTIAIILFLIGKHSSQNQKKVNVQVDISDGNTIVKYDPTELVRKLERTLTTTYIFGGTERCEALQELLVLSNASFMATVYGYEKVTGTSLIEHLDACGWYCHGYHTGNTSLNTSYQVTIKEKIAILEQTYKQV